AIVSSTVFFYIWLHLQFVRKHEKALQAEQRIQIMMSQIQPHFLYNTLSTIQALCRIDPEKAFVITEKFGAYLRSNIDFLSSPNLIPLRKELEHTRIYAEIEMTRFPNISVTYDVEEEDFPIPALTIQPLVENAIRHGVRVCQKGKVSVRVYREGDFRMIVISDNGKGFDINQVQDSGKAHIGIQNVRERIEKMCGGRMEIESVIGEGTTIRLILPAPQKTDSVGE
ncbi:MAG: histidine kinase, partial [Clostridia bacterium]|nr:histidine kinase [Clostridia bacterium]